MAFEHAIADNLPDLMDRLITFLTAHPDLVSTGQAWQKLHDITIPTHGDIFESRGVAFKAPGLGGSDEIYIGMNTWGNTAADWYNLRLYGGTAFDPIFITQTNGSLLTGFASPSPAAQILLWNAPMPYWFFANGRRVWIVAKVSTQYESGGAGFILPPCPPSYYPYPLLITGGYRDQVVRWSDTHERHRGISIPYEGSCFVRSPDGIWLDFELRYSHRTVWPAGTYKYNSTAQPIIQNLRDSFSSFPLLPLTLCTLGGDQGLAQWGEMDGAYYVPAQNSGAEDVIHIDGIDYIVFQTAHRSGNPHLFALRAD